MDKKYFLVGMPASGKSTVGKLLASQLGCTFVDLDKVIVKKEGKEITEIFAEKGESYFREVEKGCLSQLLHLNEEFVLATGGGAPCFYDNMERMNNSGTTIFLDVPVDDLFNKLKTKGTNKRPLLKDFSDSDLRLELQNKYNDRKRFFEQSDICLKQSLSGMMKGRVEEVIYAIKSLEE